MPWAEEENGMEPKTFQEAAYLAAKETADLVIKKQKDYGPGNIVALGELGIFVRLWDKINRLLTLLWRPLLAGQPPQEARNEPAEDTWDDIPGYCLCRKMLKRGWFELPMEEASWGHKDHIFRASLLQKFQEEDNQGLSNV